MIRRRVLNRAAACAMAAAWLQVQAWAGQTGAATAPVLTVSGDVGTPLSLAPTELKALPRTRVEVKEDGRTRLSRTASLQPAA